MLHSSHFPSILPAVFSVSCSAVALSDPIAWLHHPRSWSSAATRPFQNFANKNYRCARVHCRPVLRRLGFLPSGEKGRSKLWNWAHHLGFAPTPLSIILTPLAGSPHNGPGVQKHRRQSSFPAAKRPSSFLPWGFVLPSQLDNTPVSRTLFGHGSCTIEPASRLCLR